MAAAQAGVNRHQEQWEAYNKKQMWKLESVQQERDQAIARGLLAQEEVDEALAGRVPDARTAQGKPTGNRSVHINETEDEDVRGTASARRHWLMQ